MNFAQLYFNGVQCSTLKLKARNHRNQTDFTAERREGEAGPAEAARAGVPRPRSRAPPAPGGLPQQGGAGRGPGRPQQYCPQDEVRPPLPQPCLLISLLPIGLC